jgi:transposase-like protein
MSKTRRKYSKEFKEKVIKEAIETGNATLVARQYGLNTSMLNRWVREFKNPKKQSVDHQEYKDHHAAMKIIESEEKNQNKTS